MNTHILIFCVQVNVYFGSTCLGYQLTTIIRPEVAQDLSLGIRSLLYGRENPLLYGRENFRVCSELRKYGYNSTASVSIYAKNARTFSNYAEISDEVSQPQCRPLVNV